MFVPPLGQELLIPLSFTIQFSLIGKHHTLHHLLGSYSGCIIDFLLEQDKPLTLQYDRCGACVTITVGLSPVVDYQEALNASVDASLARLGNDQRLVGGLNNMDQASSSVQIMYCAVETHGQYIAPLGQVLQLMKKLIDNVAEVGISSFLGLKSSSDSTQAHPLLKLGWTLLSSAVQEHRLNDSNVQGLAESLRELVGVTEVASLIDEYIKHSFMAHLGKTQITNVTICITKCQVELKDLYEKLRMRITAYTAKRVKEMNAAPLPIDFLRYPTANKIWKWLKAHNSSTNHKSARDTCIEGTGSWFAEDKRIQNWLDEPGRMWITGGRFGKTVLFSTCVEVVHRHAFMQGVTCCCAYSYFDARESGRASRKFETLCLYGIDSNEHPEPTLAQLKTTLGEVVRSFDKIYILIDALDECDSQGELLDWMKSLQSTTQGLHFLVTSRPECIIEERMSNSSHVCLSLNGELLDNDIKTYVDECVEASDDLKLLMTEEMKKKLRVKGDRMFRLVAFWIEELKHCFSCKAIIDTLEHLPTSLNAMYASMISKIDPNHLTYVQAIMQWLLFSVQQLKLEEIAMVVGFDHLEA
ncbi:hypothetical protein PAXINDRAFT_16621 [Paxillus involutus ATCC 200175]|uniref:Nephrocystin 3-like N-terminal domain-containing protein n=1 Tax=Paxillus involutus ATCC 200175 TaxID=664439 RepID=A0A0C9SRE6_PAXIN|nr:hypothetical protein PAXINDRAFT_16621 [Paxillus involutus ATCC 200175]